MIEVSNLSKSLNEILILAILKPGRKHGYQIALELEKMSDGQFKFNHGTLYPILHKLEKAGWISGKWEAEGPKRKRKYYFLTVKGQQYAREQFSGWQQFINTFLTITGDLAQ
jgi:PadR family transcriptional regulator PadR